MCLPRELHPTHSTFSDRNFLDHRIASLLVVLICPSAPQCYLLTLSGPTYYHSSSILAAQLDLAILRYKSCRAAFDSIHGLIFSMHPQPHSYLYLILSLVSGATSLYFFHDDALLFLAWYLFMIMAKTHENYGRSCTS